MKYNKIKVSGENNLKPLKVEVVGIFPPILKKYKTRTKRKRKGKDKES